ncbi:MAG: hypothetical protein ICV66_10065 [Chitinophagaceae bacterium]|nr:hypothetical protein [Chitinophagaceae bacterium]
MKHSTFALAAFALLFSSCGKSTSTVSSKTNSEECCTGILVKKGICGQYVIELQSVDAQGLEIAANWYDSTSGKSYQNVFTVANPCDFPTAFKQGDKVNFTVGNSAKNICSLCEAFTPTPAARNIIFTSGKTK